MSKNINSKDFNSDKRKRTNSDLRDMEGEDASLSKSANCSNKEDVVSSNSMFVANTSKDENDYVGQSRINSTLLKCHDCGEEFVEKKDLIIHMKIHYEQSDDESKLEDSDTVSREGEDKGMDGKWSHEGNSSNKDIRGRDDLEKHVEVHTEERESKDKLGKKEFDRGRNNLEKQKKGQSGKKHFKCRLCKEKFSRSGKLKKHENVHKIGGYFKCRFCSSGFADIGMLKEHERKHPNYVGCRLFKCKFCPKKLTWIYLKKHEKIHEKELPFNCHHCGKAFPFKNMIVAHMIMHTGETPFQCDSCPRKCTTRYNLKIHRKIHINKGKRPSCKFCGKKYIREHNLKKHEQSCR